jgi:ATP-binding cassette subfamily B protein
MKVQAEPQRREARNTRELPKLSGRWAAPPRAEGPPDQKPLDRATIRRLFTFTKPYAKTRNLLALFVLVRAIQLPLLSWAIAKVISGPIAHHDVTRTLWGLGLLFLLVVSTVVNFSFRMLYALRLGELVVYDLRRAIYTHVQRMPMSFFNRMPLGRLLSRITSDVDVVRVGIQDVVFVGTVQFGGMLIAGVMMLYYDPALFLVIVAFVPPIWLLIRYFSSRMREAYRDVQETYSRLTASIAESVNRMRVIQAFCRQEENDVQFAEQVRIHAHNNFRGAVSSAIFVPLLELNGQFMLSLVIVLGGYQALTGRVGLESLVQFLFLCELFFGPVPVLGRLYNQALSAMAGAERVFALLDSEPDWQDKPNAVELTALSGQVRFDGVSFEYTEKRPVLQNISFEIEPGQTVALVGATGSGKSTITRLLSKLFLPTHGKISIDGIDLLDIQGLSLHRHLATVPQDNFLFSGTVLDNIRFARPTASLEEVTEVCRALDVLDLVLALPHAFNTEVGEKGGNLSLGQRQVVCFARAMLANPRLLVLDEATSSVDVLTEARLQHALQKLLASRTSVVVAHRLSTILHADQIIVLEQGRIVERGRHAELLQRRGAYATLYTEFVRQSAASMDEPAATA